MSLATVKKTFEKFGRDDPLYAVLSRKGLRHNKWDPDEFFQTGNREIGRVLRYVDALRLPLARRRALDFGCGVGRLSQALAEHFQQVVGVDIAESMIEHACRYNRHGERVRYLLNTTDRLQILDAESFDFVYSSLTLQHIPPEPAGAYIREFFRVLRPGGVAVFQVPNGRPYKAGSIRAWWYRIERRHLQPIWKVLRGRSPVQMHYIPRGQVQSIVEGCGGRIVDVVDLGRRAKPNKRLRYCTTR
jgi:2-polyprenyl-3-methyl-5-hydroxy-6-metoxy-1,4-benzoquinol methylase